MCYSMVLDQQTLEPLISVSRFRYEIKTQVPYFYAIKHQ